jgi:hypothetical protein
MWIALTLAGAVAAWAAWISWRYPVLPRPRWKFNSIVPRLLNTGAVAVLGWCFVAGNTIGSYHRAHEEYHHRRVVALGRWRHLATFLLDFVRGLFRHGFATVQMPSGKRYLKAYWWHPEEIAARGYEMSQGHTYTALGGSR